jgi:NTP pyrophosphatase (non-canonical NTP hydrolase)
MEVTGINVISHRFRGKSSTLEILAKLTEETGEVAQAVLLASSAINKSASGDATKSQANLDHDVREEAVDVMLVALDLFFRHGGTEAQLGDLVFYKSKKWLKKLKEDS